VRPEFPRSSQYDAQWVIENEMGFHVLWLTEWLCQGMHLSAEMRVLDLGCGKALSSIFLAREYGVQVWATDLWISATDNHTQIERAGLSGRVFPIHADARSLPYAEGFFDAIVCVDAYIYFGTDDLYLDYLHRFVKPGGQIGIVVPGFMRELEGPLPDHLRPFWAQECWTWHTAEWWRRHWSRTGLVNVHQADRLPEGWKIWLQWEKARRMAGDDSPEMESDIKVLEVDGGQYMGFIRMVAERNA
jgi:cyclopropane fatty-acyl-phospholipid synthase-like methyltransferase